MAVITSMFHILNTHISEVTRLCTGHQTKHSKTSCGPHLIAQQSLGRHLLKRSKRRGLWHLRYEETGSGKQASVTMCRAWVKTHEMYDKLKEEFKKRRGPSGHRAASGERPADHRSSRSHDRDRDRHREGERERLHGRSSDRDRDRGRDRDRDRYQECRPVNLCASCVADT